MTAKETERAEAIADLRKTLRAGDTLYTTLCHVSRSGMQRVIGVYVIRHNQPRWIGWWAAKALGWTYDRKREGVKVGGCGMDMGFHLVYALAYAVFGGTRRFKRWAAKQGPHQPCDPGYMLKQRWL